MRDFDRRDFLKTGVASVAVASGAAFASVGSAFAAESTSYAGVVYSKEQQGQWEGKAGSHAPQVKVEGGKVSLVTIHPMTEEHFIVRHTLVLSDGKVAGGTTFSPADTPESSFDLPKGYKGKACATSFCNKHDLWVTEFIV